MADATKSRGFLGRGDAVQGPESPPSRHPKLAMRVSTWTRDADALRPGIGPRPWPAPRPRRCETRCRMLSRDISAALHISRNLLAGAGGRSRWLSQAAQGTEVHQGRSLGESSGHPRRATMGGGHAPAISLKARVGHEPGDRRKASFSRRILAGRAPRPWRTSPRRSSSILGRSDFYRANFRAGPAQAGSEGERRLVRSAQKLRE